MIILDCETTGVDKDKHVICSLGALCYIEPSIRSEYNRKIWKAFYKACKIPSFAEIQNEALSVNGFSRDELSDPNKPTLEELLHQFNNWRLEIPEELRKKYGVAHFLFDMGMVNRWSEEFNIPLEIPGNYADLQALCVVSCELRGIAPPCREGSNRVRVDRILNYVGLPGEPKPHNAFVGAMMETEAFERFNNGEVLFADYLTYKVPKYLPIHPGFKGRE